MRALSRIIPCGEFIVLSSAKTVAALAPSEGRLNPDTASSVQLGGQQPWVADVAPPERMVAVFGGATSPTVSLVSFPLLYSSFSLE